MKYAMVCSSNQNRSMEAHALLKKEHFDVHSYGTGQHVKLPGPSVREPNVYDFGTPYKHMFDDLRRKDPELYKRNGILPMLRRNFGVKSAPQRWQDNANDGLFDVVLTFEEKVFDMVLEDLHNRNHVEMKPVLVINLEVKDNHEEAATGAQLALNLCQELEAVESWEESIDSLILNFERQRRESFCIVFRFIDACQENMYNHICRACRMTTLDHFEFTWSIWERRENHISGSDSRVLKAHWVTAVESN